MKKNTIVALFILATVGVISSCGRSAQGPIALTPSTDQVQNQPASPQTTQQQVARPDVPGTFNPPNAGVKVTSANTVVEAAKSNEQQNTAQSQPAATQQQNPTTTTKQPEAQVTPNTQVYTVQKGDTISVIANVKYGIKIAELLALNQGVSDKDEIQPGQQLFVPN